MFIPLQAVTKRQIYLMARLEEKIAEIKDPELRGTIAEEVKALKAQKQFGLVFEQHQPEVVRVFRVPVRAGVTVAKKAGSLTETWRVVRVRDGIAELVKDSDDSRESAPVDTLTVVRRMGQAIHPALVQIDHVQNGDPSQPHHILIEADNYHALQLLDYIYAGKVDCIYIDPPYNSGSRDWKYNNDYVDKNDGWRHSKWLAFMERRLRLAKKLLNPVDSTLIVAIDDNELFTLGLLLDDVFNGCDQQIVNVTINPKGKARDGRLSQVDEYLIVVYIGEAKAQEITVESSEVEVRWPYLRRSDVESARGTKKGGTRQFYPIYVDERTEKIVAIGEPLTPKQSLASAVKMEGAVPVFPIRDDGKHMNWGLTGPSLKNAAELGFVRVSKSSNEHQPYNFTYVTVPSIKKVQDGIYRVVGVKEDGSRIVVIPGGKIQRGTTAWKKNLHDANAYGSQVVGTFIHGKKFPFPKSIYAVFDTLQLFLANKPNALLVDFFAGSGTTLHALNLLNAADGGQRQCILVTNNEVSEEEASSMTTQGLQPGDDVWDAVGICRSVTWPRNKFTILGKRDDNTALSDEYFTGRTVRKEKVRTIRQLGLAEGRTLSLVQRKQLAALMPALPQSKLVADAPWFLDEDSPMSVLWDVQQSAAWLEELAEAEHLTDILVVTSESKFFNALAVQIKETLGPLLVEEDEKRPMAAGFATNLDYFKLDFLEPTEVAMGRQFAAILPMLWMMAGAKGPRPEAPDAHAHWMLPEGCPFVVLMREGRFREFLAKIEDRTDLTHVFLVTNSDSAYHDMRNDLPKHIEVVQLYKNYLENFKINTQRR